MGIVLGGSQHFLTKLYLGIIPKTLVSLEEVILFLVNVN